MSEATPFDRLHPALQHHVVNTLGWKQLRRLQEEAIGPLLQGEHALLIAPTAGGKTEAAFFPVLSRMLQEDWRGLSVLYVCPIKALLNNLTPRLEKYAGLVGRSVDLWHGDVGQTARKRIRSFPPDVLLTTPESIEVMLTSTKTNPRQLFENVRCVVIDELHAFAGDDRGWHLLAVLERVMRIASGEIQRLGLSATIGNPEDLLRWLCGSAKGGRSVIAPAGEPGADAASQVDVTLDFVGSLTNAAKVIAGLHHGEKRLVFCDSRSRVEELAAELRRLRVNTFVSHSSLSADERRQAERAFAEEREAVIAATSTLELGIDVGDLDRVIQIDSPWTVASFLQRVGRTGRREGSSRNCLFLATRQESFIRAAGLLRLWSDGYVEPVESPQAPYHILAQQLMALVLQEGRIGRNTWHEWLRGMPALETMGPDHVEAIVDHMIDRGILFDDEGMLSMGVEGERSFGRRHFMEVMSVFTSDPLFSVRHGRQELGQVHPLSLQRRQDESAILLLGGRSWAVTNIDWRERVAYVKASEDRGKTRWFGIAQPLHFRLCRAIRTVLSSGEMSPALTERGREALETARDELSWLEDGETAIVRHLDGSLRWWTFAGLRANTALADLLCEAHPASARAENLSIRLADPVWRTGLDTFLNGLTPDDIRVPGPEYLSDAIDGLKFSSCLPRSIAAEMLSERLRDSEAIVACLSESRRFVAVS